MAQKIIRKLSYGWRLFATGFSFGLIGLILRFPVFPFCPFSRQSLAANKPGKPCHFQRGAATIALQANKMVMPVTLSCYPGPLTKTDQWYQIPNRRFHLTMYVDDDVALEEFATI